ncbi:MAG: hypothetical protein JXN10_09500 [Clostridia bacterium]|nr:hypothetical protein [Clostridia bacterium]
MISGRENINKAIEFKGPSWLPVHIDVNFDWLAEKDTYKQEKARELLKEIKSDMVVRGYHSPAEKNVTVDGSVRSWKDEWDVGWADDGRGARVVYHPLEKGYQLLDSYVMPEAGNKDWFVTARRYFEEDMEKFRVGTVWFTLFERLWMLRGFNNMLMDPYLDEMNFFSLQESVIEFNLRQIDVWSDIKVDAVYFSDDWGSQRSLLINPDDWRKYYKHAYKKMFEKIRKNKMKVFMHLCGNVTEIIPDLIEIGLNVLNPVQPQAMDINELSQKFGGQLCFYGGIDVQGTLIHGSRDDIRKEIYRLVDLFGKFNGGYICSTSHSIMPETPLDNVISMLEAVKEFQ